MKKGYSAVCQPPLGGEAAAVDQRTAIKRAVAPFRRRSYLPFSVNSC